MQKNISDSPGIYIHIPYCEKKCPYCDFYSLESSEHRKDFIPFLIKEMEQAVATYEFSRPFDTIYFGGGTPSLLNQDELETVMAFIGANFSLSRDTEITLEANPGTLTKEKLKFLIQSGINRLSLGIQSFDDKELRFLGRIHSAGQGVKTFELARDVGFSNISIDLIFGLPQQTTNTWLTNLEQAVKLNPEHLSVYNLTYEKGTLLNTSMINKKFIPLKPEQELGLLKETLNFLRETGYNAYEVSNYARGERFISRHNSKYWNHVNYLGFGPSAHSLWQDTRSENISSIKSYIKALAENQKPAVFSERLNKKTMELETIFLGLRTYKGIDLDWFERCFGHSFMKKYKNHVNLFLNAGFAEASGNYFRLTQKGMFIVDEILPEFVQH